MPWALANDDRDTLHRQAHSNARMLEVNSSLNLRDGIRRGVLGNSGVTFFVITASGEIEDISRAEATLLIRAAIAAGRISSF